MQGDDGRYYCIIHLVSVENGDEQDEIYQSVDVAADTKKELAMGVARALRMVGAWHPWGTDPPVKFDTDERVDCHTGTVSWATWEIADHTYMPRSFLALVWSNLQSLIRV